MEPIVNMLNEQELLIESNGALIVELGDDMPPCLIKKSDGATLYATRDLTAAIDRKRTHNFVNSMYVVGYESTRRNVTNNYSNSQYHLIPRGKRYSPSFFSTNFKLTY